MPELKCENGEIKILDEKLKRQFNFNVTISLDTARVKDVLKIQKEIEKMLKDYNPKITSGKG
jgi:hypothetical protein